MAVSVLLYAGLVLALAGAVSLIRPLRCLLVPTRRRAAAVLALGVLLVVMAMALPAPLIQAATATTLLDEFIPSWQFEERHEIRIRASPGQVEQAVRTVTAREIRLFRLLTWLRRPRRPWGPSPEDILAPPADRPILDVALGSGFLLLGERPGREIVIGTLVATPVDRHRANRSADEFRDLSGPGYGKAVMNFRIDGEGDGWTTLVTETRVFATDDATRRRFALYWRAILPGSSLIRYTWLRAIRRRAEAELSEARAAQPRSQPVGVKEDADRYATEHVETTSQERLEEEGSTHG